MRAASTFTAIGSALLLAAVSAHGMGFGRVVNATQLGQPLNFGAALRLESDESLERECISAEVQSGDNKLPSAQVRATLEGLGNERTVRVTTQSIIDEPVVTISVTVGCASKITRKFVAFIDPPLINLPDSSSNQAAATTLPPQRNDSQVAPLVTLVEGEKPVPAAPQEAAPRQPRPERKAPQAPRVRERVAPPPRVVAAPRPDEPSATPRPPRSTTQRQSSGGSRVAAAPSGPRLKLEAPPSKAATAASAASMPLPAPAAPTPPVAAASAADESASGAAAGGKDADLLAAERERIRLLEDGLNKLRTDSQATQTTIATLQAKLKEAESQRFSNPLVYGLAWLSALLALAMLGLLWRQARVRNSSQWWTAPAPTQTPPAQNQAAGAPSTLAEPRHLPPNSGPGALPAMPPHLLDYPATGAGSFGAPTVIEEDDPVRAAGYAQTQVPTGFMPTMPAPPIPAPPEPAVRELSVEELIDLEQQAEFFIVLGQDEAAIELLMSHVRTDGGISPLPYLKLLEIYRRRGESDAYERIRDRFNRRFNAYAPDWNADMQHGRTLEDYPETISRLQALWATPTRAMETLDASLFRRNKTDETFDLPAYRELLFLYSVSRDLAEHGGSAPLPDVDVLLPLSNDPDAEPIHRLSASLTGEFRNSDMMTMPLDLDVSFPSSGESAGRPGSAPDSGFIDFDLNEPYEPKKKS